jgi:hypothetical protein
VLAGRLASSPAVHDRSSIYWKKCRQWVPNVCIYAPYPHTTPTFGLLKYEERTDTTSKLRHLSFCHGRGEDRYRAKDTSRTRAHRSTLTLAPAIRAATESRLWGRRREDGWRLTLFCAGINQARSFEGNQLENANQSNFETGRL